MSALCNPMDCSTPGTFVLHSLLEFAHIHVDWVGDTLSSSTILYSFCLQSFPASGSFPVSQIFESRGQSIGASASASVLPMNIHSKVKISFKIQTSNRCPLGRKKSDVTEWLNWTEQMSRNKSKKVANLLQILITMDKLLYGWHIPYQWIGYPNITKILISRNI